MAEQASAPARANGATVIIAPSTGPIIVLRLAAIEHAQEDQARGLVELAASVDRLAAKIDAYLDPAMDAQGVVAQVIDMGRTHSTIIAARAEALSMVARTLANELAAIRGWAELNLGTADLERGDTTEVGR